MADIKVWQKNEHFGKNYFNVFQREVAVQAKQVQQERGLPPVGSAREHSSDEEVDQESVKRLGTSRKKI